MLRAALAFLAVGVLAVGCGDDDERAAQPVERSQMPYLDLSEVGSLIDRHLDTVRTGGQASMEDDVQPAAVETARLETNGGAELDVVVFPTVADAREYQRRSGDWPVVEDGGAAIRAANVIVAVPERQEEGPYAIAWDLMRRLGDACADREDAEAQLRRLCFDPDPPDPGPPGQGSEPGEAVPTGEAVRLAGVEYRVILARVLNPYIRPDRNLVGGRRPTDDASFVGVFLKACNDGGDTVAPSGELTLIGGFGARVAPVALPASNAFEYEQRRLRDGRCIPAEGSAAERVNGGALVLFEVPRDVLDDRPLALEIADTDERVYLRIDI